MEAVVAVDPVVLHYDYCHYSHFLFVSPLPHLPPVDEFSLLFPLLKVEVCVSMSTYQRMLQMMVLIDTMIPPVVSPFEVIYSTILVMSFYPFVSVVVQCFESFPFFVQYLYHFANSHLYSDSDTFVDSD